MPSTAAADTIDWTLDPSASRLGRCGVYLVCAPLLGAALGAVGGLAVVLPSLLQTPALLALVGVLVLVGGPMSLLYLLPILTDPDQRSGLGPPSFLADLHPLGLGVAAVGGLGLHFLALRVGSHGPLLVVGGSLYVGLPALSVLSGAGSIDRDALELTQRSAPDRPFTGARTVDMTTWTDVRQYQFGSLVLLRPSYARGAETKGPRVISLPKSAATDATDVFDRAVAAPSPERTRPANPLVAAILALFGGGCLVTGVALWQFVGFPRGTGVWIVSVCAVFGLLFLSLAWRER